MKLEIDEQPKIKLTRIQFIHLFRSWDTNIYIKNFPYFFSLSDRFKRYILQWISQGWLKNPKYCPSRSFVFFLIFTYGCCLILCLTSIQKYPVLLLSHVTTFNCFRRQLFFYFTLKVVDVFRWPNRQFFCLNFHEWRQCDEANIVGCWKRSMTVSKEHA